MTKYTVSTQSQLKSALNKAKGGDTISLKSGNYGSLSLSNEKYTSKVTITSESTSKPANFSAISLSSVSNLTFDHVNLTGKVVSGYGTGTGFKVSSSSNVTLQNSDLSDFYKGVQVWNASSFKVLGNDIDNIGYDGIVIGHSQGVTIQGNEVHMHSHGDSHRDVIQFYNQGAKAPSSNVTIKGNVLTSDDGVTHGIFFGNADTKGSNTAEFYKNITIEGNTIKTAQKLGVAIGGAQGVSIKSNVVVQTNEYSSKKAVNTPMILIDKDAKSVSLSGNTVVKAPAIADDANNWKIVSTLSNTGSKIVALGAPVADATSTSSKTVSSSSSSSSSSSLGDGEADHFRFSGTKVNGSTTNKLSVDFSEGDTVTLSKYDKGTFDDIGGGNYVHNSTGGGYVKIDSLTDLQELTKASGDIKAKVSGDTLTIDIHQDSGTHHLVLAGLGHEYQNSYDSSLF
ncbi:right-handed parallel beta-helix repeat-containing protein [Amaricoccus solimangrovi]|uniref:Right handed beta helix domain-containing protein n=1 Tax=Amaricoccus solimangrovi TaxID=2589815 RepID=A0A501WJ78_9RHOB|nr:right-handed parallel beta-helix repeat-containing protein [Amaricoccus solimangrovi]TPE48420.1 hypothetical protein FJM51_17825 [Amaricoccus solimangrovi]